jgi:hypothetical protein
MKNIMKDIYMSCKSWILLNIKKAIDLNITHIIIVSDNKIQALSDRFEMLYLSTENYNAFHHLPSVADFLKKTSIRQGKALFVESDDDIFSNHNGLIRELILLSLN